MPEPRHILKTWPAFMPPRKVLEIFSAKWARFYFSLGRGKPTQQISHVWFTYRGRILGNFPIEEIVINDGSLPKLKSLSGEASGWQFKPDVYVMICVPPMVRLREKLYYSSFRGWRYFDLAAWREEPEAMIQL
jgi:hypothetical protein